MSALRFLADDYEQNQRLRIQIGERIRAVLQQRDTTWSLNGYELHSHEPEENECERCEAILDAIGSGKEVGPVPALGRAYNRHYQGEREAFSDMKASLENHPAWPWLKKVKGIGPTFACKLLARLDIHKAPHPSSFWAYCGLDTVPAKIYRCEECSLERAFPEDYEVSGKHQRLKSKNQCNGRLIEIGAGRCARPRPAAGQKSAYDRKAKVICYLIAISFLKAVDSPYEQFYRKARAGVETEMVHWTPARIHAKAWRKTMKLFLSHLWLVWRKAEGLPVSQPYAQAHLGHDGLIDPQEMVD